MFNNSTPPSLSNTSTTIMINSTSIMINSTSIMINSTMMNLSTSGVTPTFPLEIEANDITSRANYVYSFFASLGFIAGCFLLYSFIQTYRAQRRLAWLDCLLWVFCGLQLLLLLLSLHAVAYRPAYLMTTALGCATLSFFINTASLCSLLVLVLMAYVLTFDPPSHALLRKRGVCAALVIMSSVLISLLLAGLRGPRDDLQNMTECIMDANSGGVLYAAAKLCLAFLIPYSIQMGLLIFGCVRQWKCKGRFLSGSEEGPMFLSVTAVTFFCLLFYNVVLVRGAQLQTNAKQNPLQSAFQSVSEFVLFSASSASLLIMLVMHRPCRDSLHGVVRQLRHCCRSPGHTPTNRNIIAPQIEITDTLQDMES
ncbi:uncharacterized protein LOC113156163 [Anabas testudineus]|uniref:G-protein coupled receptors family 1 profile domain-containing protein n=1 Tax=Anabas testudineus TaxID=64144 RepID=A0A3Q1IPQ5_ANATE|nr:uncharacterized protein LOC113156163 [Anabas testudineus]